MKSRIRFPIPLFSIGLSLFGLILLIFPSLRVAGLLAVLLAAAYTVLALILGWKSRGQA